MKKILALGAILVMLFSSCSGDLSDANFYFETLPIESVTLPNGVEFGKTSTIDYSYFHPSNYLTYSDLYYLAKGNTREVAVVNSVLDRDVDCESLTYKLVEKSFNFFYQTSNWVISI